MLVSVSNNTDLFGLLDTRYVSGEVPCSFLRGRQRIFVMISARQTPKQPPRKGVSMARRAKHTSQPS